MTTSLKKFIIYTIIILITAISTWTICGIVENCYKRQQERENLVQGLSLIFGDDVRERIHWINE